MEESKTVHVTPPTTPTKATPPQSTSAEQMSLSSPELLKELTQPHSLRHVSVHKGGTMVFWGQGRGRQNQEGVDPNCTNSQQRLHSKK